MQKMCRIRCVGLSCDGLGRVIKSKGFQSKDRCLLEDAEIEATGAR